MPLKVTFELSDRDLGYFRKVMRECGRRADGGDGEAIIESAEKALEALPSDAPEFVKDRACKLAGLVGMLRDEEWQLEGKDRDHVVKTLAYFAEPADLIPDAVPGIGYLDDAIMVELVMRELRHELEAYEDFKKYRSQKAELLKKSKQDATSRDEWLTARREQLKSRMRRRYRRQGRF